MKTKTYNVMSYSEFDRLATYALGRDYESIAFNEWGNGEDHARENVKGELMDWQLVKIAKFIAGAKMDYFGYGEVLEWLVMHGHLQPGNYMIEVSW